MVSSVFIRVGHRRKACFSDTTDNSVPKGQTSELYLHLYIQTASGITFLKTFCPKLLFPMINLGQSQTNDLHIQYLIRLAWQNVDSSNIKDYFAKWYKNISLHTRDWMLLNCGIESIDGLGHGLKDWYKSLIGFLKYSGLDTHITQRLRCLKVFLGGSLSYP